MYRELQRPLNEAEIRLLNERAKFTSYPVTIPSTLLWLSVWTLGLATSVVLIAWLVSTFPTIGPIVAALPGVLGLVCILCLYMLLQGHFHWSNHYRRLMKQTRPQLLQAIENGTARVQEVEADAVAVIAPFEDEGAGFIYDVGNGSLLFLKGQEYELFDEANRWPNTRFSIVYTTFGDFFVGIFCDGDQLEPALTIDSEACRPDIVWSNHEELIRGDLHEFTRSLVLAG